jgi:uncharacterized membrane protein
MPDAVTTTALLVGLFVGTHLLPGLPRIRGPLVARLGELRFALAYSLVSWATLGAMLWYYASHGSGGPPGLGLASIPACWWTAVILMTMGMVLMVAILAPSGYLASSLVVFGRHSREPRGLERITRHPFFVGLTLLCIGHILVADRLVGVIVFSGFGLLAVVGAVLQDRKLLLRRGEEHAAYLAATSSVPFLAILRDRQSLALHELPWLFLGLGLPGAWATRALHGTGYGPGLVMTLLVLGPLWFGVRSSLRERATERSERGRA